MENKLSILHANTTWGSIAVRVADGAVIRCDVPFVLDEAPDSFRFLKSKITAVTDRDRNALMAADAFIRGTLSGKPAKSPRVKIPQGTELQTAVWTYLSRMKAGEYVTYGELARFIGYDRAARAVGQACGANPIPLFIPCHRVLGVGNRAGGFSCGMAWKYLLIQMDSGKSMMELKHSLRAFSRVEENSRRVA